MHYEAAQKMQSAANVNFEAAQKMENASLNMEVNIHRMENVLINFTTKLEEIYAAEELQDEPELKRSIFFEVFISVLLMIVGAVAYATFPGLP